jgi:hypothetical protein
VSHSKAHYKTDAYLSLIVPAGHRHCAHMVRSASYWTRVFGKDRSGADKAIVLVEGRGTI